MEADKRACTSVCNFAGKTIKGPLQVQTLNPLRALQVAVLPGPSGKRLTQKLAEATAMIYSCRLQIQERLTHQIAAHLLAELQAAGVLLLCKASHMCMVARGVEQHASSTVTVAAYGVFEHDHALRRQAMRQLTAHPPDQLSSGQ